jgi:hypothetical protein
VAELMPPLTRPTLTKKAEREIRSGGNDRGTAGVQEVSQTRRLWCLWSERTDVVDYFVGHAEVVDEGGGVKRLRRLLPMSHPDDPRLIAERVEFLSNHDVTGVQNAVSDSTKQATYAKTDYALHYARVPYLIRADAEVEDAGGDPQEWLRFTSVGNFRTSATYYNLPPGVLKYLHPSATAPPHGNVVPFSVGKVVPQFTVDVVWHRLPQAIWDWFNPSPLMRRVFGDPDTGVDSLLGTVNDDWLLDLFPPTTALLLDAKPIDRPSPVNVVGVEPGREIDMVYTYEVQPQSFLKLYYHDTVGVGAGVSGYWPVGRGNTYFDPFADAVTPNNSIYNAKDHTKLWAVN